MALMDVPRFAAMAGSSRWRRSPAGRKSSPARPARCAAWSDAVSRLAGTARDRAAAQHGRRRDLARPRHHRHRVAGLRRPGATACAATTATGGASAGSLAALASRATTSSRTFAPATRSASAVCSFGLWLMPPVLGTKIMAAGAMRAIIWASWPAPEVMRRDDRPRAARRRLDQPDDPCVEDDRLEPRQPLDRDRHAFGGRELVEIVGERRLLGLQPLLVRDRAGRP